MAMLVNRAAAMVVTLTPAGNGMSSGVVRLVVVPSPS